MIQKRSMPASAADWCPLDDTDELQAFIDRHWRAEHVLARDAKLLHWQFPGEQPGCLNVLVARDEQGIAGILGVIPFPYCQRGIRGRGAWLSMWVVRKELQSSGIGLQLLHQVLQTGYDCIGTLGGNGTTMRILGALRFHTRESLTRWILPGSAEALASLAKSAPPEVAARMLQSATQASATQASAKRAEASMGGDGTVVPWSDDVGDAWDEAWRRRFAPNCIGAWRDSEYLGHRYLRHPSFRYQVRVCTDREKRVRGLLVYRVIDIRDRDEKVVRVLEWLVEPGAHGPLLETLGHAARQSNVAFADFYCTSPSAGRELCSLGFQMEDTSGPTFPSRFQPLDFRKGGVSGAFACAPSSSRDSRAFFNDPRTYFTSADCDQDRPN